MDGVFMKKLIKLVFGCALVAAFLWFGSVLADRQRLNEDLIRLHVVANSDEAEDQNLKLQVRDAVVESLRTALADVQDTEQAKQYLQKNLPALQELANRTLDAAGSAQRAVVSLCREAFPVRDYDTFRLPAGTYNSLRIRIGEGEGKNWWCVVFPSLCLPQTESGFRNTAKAAGIPDSLACAISEDSHYEIRFFFLDKLGELEKLFAK